MSQSNRRLIHHYSQTDTGPYVHHISSNPNMTVDETITLTRSDDQSITVSSGADTFTIAFCKVPRVSGNAERRFQRV